MAEPVERQTGKTRKRSAVKASSVPSASKVKVTLHISVEADQRLDIHRTMMRLDRSELVELLITRHLRRFVVSDRGGEEGGNSEMEERMNS